LSIWKDKAANPDRLETIDITWMNLIIWEGERMTAVPKIAIVGCGAISASYYLPTLREYGDVWKRLILVETNEERRRWISDEFGISGLTQDYHETLDKVDGVIIATPHYSHHPIAMDFLRQGVHVLCEKPLAVTAPDAKEMVAQAEKSGVTLSVNNFKRLFPSFIAVKRLISDGSIGNLRSITYYEGHEFHGWPTASGFYFDKQRSPKGALLDLGAHALDAVCWWMGKPDLVSCRTDSFGGPEACASVKFRLKSCVGEVRLSWLANLQDLYTIQGDGGNICGGTRDSRSLTAKFGSAQPRLIEADQTTDSSKATDEMIDNFLSVILEKAEPLIPAREVIESLELIDECYDAAERFSMPWTDNVECI